MDPLTNNLTALLGPPERSTVNKPPQSFRGSVPKRPKAPVNRATHTQDLMQQLAAQRRVGKDGTRGDRIYANAFRRASARGRLVGSVRGRGDRYTNLGSR